METNVKQTIRLYELLKKAQSNEDFLSYEQKIVELQKPFIKKSMQQFHTRLEFLEIHCHISTPNDIEESSQFLENLQELEKSISSAFKANKDFQALFRETQYQSYIDRGVFVIANLQTIRYLQSRILSLPTSKRIYVSKELLLNPLRIFETQTKKSFAELRTNYIDPSTIHSINQAAGTPKTLETRLMQGIEALLIKNSPYVLTYESLSRNLLSFSQSVQRREGLFNQTRRLLYQLVSIFTLVFAHFTVGILLFWIFNPLSTLYPVDASVELFSWATLFNFLIYPIVFLFLNIALIIGFRYMKVEMPESLFDYLSPLGIAPVMILIFAILSHLRPAMETGNFFWMWIFVIFSIIYSLFETGINLVRKSRVITRVNQHNDTEALLVQHYFNRYTDNVLQWLYLPTVIPMTLFVSRVDGGTYFWMFLTIACPMIVLAVMQFGYYQRNRVLGGE